MKSNKCPSAEMDKKTWYIHTMGYHSATTKDGQPATCNSSIDGYQSVILTRNKKKTEASYDITYMWNPTFSFQSLLGAQNNNQLQMQDQVSS